MNNDFNNFEKKDDKVQNSEQNQNEVLNTPQSSGVQNSFSGAGDSERSSSERGEYHYNGSQMGAYGKENTSGGGSFAQNQNGYGSYGQPGYNGQQQVDRQSGDNQPYASQSGWNQHQPFGGNMPPYTPPESDNGKKRRSGKGISRSALAVVCTVCILFSAAAGFGGAYLYNHYNNGVYDTASGNVSSGTAVIHRTVETDGVTSTGQKGAYTDVAAAVKDSVVEITTEYQVTGFFQYVSEGAGSGVIISEDGYIITNNHVIANSSTGGYADSITVRLTNGKEYKASIVGSDSDSDIAVIKITPDESLSYAVFGDSDKLAVGEEVIAVGNPLGELGGTVTNGIISALDREISVDGTKMNLLQTNAAINPGNSGGGLFNMKGELVGIVNAKSSGSDIEGLGFAIPANDAYIVAGELMQNGYVTGKTYLGVSFYDVTDEYTAYRYFKSQSTGVYVAKLEEGYNDDVLKVGDRVVAVDGNEITEFSQIKDILKSHEVGDKIKFTIYRDGKLTEAEATCYEYKPAESQAVDFDSES